MRDSDDLASAFIELETIMRGTTRLPGLDAARAEARRRQGVRVAWAAGAMIVVVLAGVATVVPGWLRTGAPAVVEPTPFATLGSAPTNTAAAAPARVLVDMTPPARIRNATLEVPPFDLAECPSGRLTFQDGLLGSADSVSLTMQAAAVGDVDADGVEDIVLALTCALPSETHGVTRLQVVAYSGAELTARGTIAVGGNATDVASLEVNAGGDIELGLAQLSVPRAQIVAIAFDRYHWSGAQFERIEHVDVSPGSLPQAVLSVGPTSLHLAPGGPTQPIVVTVHNDGPASDRPLRVGVLLSAPVFIEVAGLPGRAAAPGQKLLISAPKAGEAVTIVLRVGLPAGATIPTNSSIIVSLLGQRPQADGSDAFAITLGPA